MNNIFSNIYYRLRRKEIEESKLILKKIQVENILNSISKVCWRSGVNYEIIMKNKKILILKLKGKKEIVFVEYYRGEIVLLHEVERFEDIISRCYVDKGFFITCGVFQFDMNSKNRTYKKIKFIDNLKFIQEQLGFIGKAKDTFKKNKIKFYKYLPQ